jgi:hypothetical protein
MKAEYDFSGGVRGKYVEQYRRGTNVVVIEPELTRAFPDSKSVNDALRALVKIASRAERHKLSRPQSPDSRTCPVNGKSR